MAEPRSYRQNCGLAFSLDLLGERWTLLIVRELARGPKRFRDLESSLHGIGANLLTTRLKRLQASGVTERVDVAPGVGGYGLTTRGDALTVALEDLVLWGADLLEPPSPHLETRAAWAAMSMRAWMDRQPRPPADGTYAFSVGDESFWLRTAEGRSVLRDGRPPYPADATLTVDKDHFLAVAAGLSTLEHSDAHIDGDKGRLRNLFKTFRLPPTSNLTTAETHELGRVRRPLPPAVTSHDPPTSWAP